jgi:hypothetical protein
MSSVGSLITGRSDIGTEIAYAVFSMQTGMIDLMRLERWMTFARQEYTTLEEERYARQHELASAAA